MGRTELLQQLGRTEPWDIVIIGGGAVGMGAAWDAASRGHSVVVLEQYDFCKGTSSRSTKLIHGGVRYLAQGNVSLVREALHERGVLLRNAPELVTPLRFIVPCYGHMERWYYAAGMKCYDALAGRLGIGSSRQLSTNEFQAAIPAVAPQGLRGGVAYFDAQFDDAGLLIATAQKVQELGGVPLNYMRVTELIKENGKTRGVVVCDTETGDEHRLRASVVVNASGVFSDEVRRLDHATAPPMIAPSQGIHLVLDRRFLGGDDALMIPKTKDGRVLFAIPWLGRTVLGTTDTPVTIAEIEPRPLDEEVSYLVEHFANYLQPSPTKSDILSVFAGLRPLVNPSSERGATSKISREHRVITSGSGLVSVLGGKWTTYRKMGADVVDVAEQVASLRRQPSATKQMRLTAPKCRSLDGSAVPTDEAVRVAVRHEFARTVEDVLARRFRHLLLDAKGSLALAGPVAKTMAAVLGRSPQWESRQIEDYKKLVSRYTV